MRLAAGIGSSVLRVDGTLTDEFEEPLDWARAIDPFGETPVEEEPSVQSAPRRYLPAGSGFGRSVPVESRSDGAHLFDSSPGIFGLGAEVFDLGDSWSDLDET